MTASLDHRRRWLALYLLCVSVLMIVLDTTVVTVALPSMRVDLGFSETSLVWVLNAYMLTFGGFLLLGGRLGDLYGNRRWFLIGLVVFLVASLACGLAGSRAMLVIARAVQGLGGAVVAAVALALIINLFTDAEERARAMGVYAFVCAVGGTIGEVLGGVLTHWLSWKWVFLINLPIGLAAYVACLRLLPRDADAGTREPLDVAGAVTVTLGLMLAVYAIVDGNHAGWTSPQTLALLAGAVVLLGAFLAIEARIAHPLMPLHLFRLRNLATANAVAVLWAAGMFAWFVIAALYMQRVLAFNPMQVGFAFLPADGIMAAFALGLSARVVLRYGIRTPTWVGLLLAAAGLLLFARAPLDGSFVVDVLPGMVLLGVGGGLSFNPLLLAAMNDVDEAHAGLASGVVNTSFMMGGALGLAVIASIGDAWTGSQLARGVDPLGALNDGYRLAFLLGGILTALAALLAAWLLRVKPQATPAAAVAAVP